jgi:SOS regulatory protein LexA
MLNDSQYLSALRDYYAKHRVLPSYAVIGRLVGLSSKGSVAEMIERLKAQRFLESTKERRLQPGKRFFERAVADHVRAGRPETPGDLLPELLSIDQHLIRLPSRSTLVRVKGDSMVDAGILEGDIVVVEKRATANDGDLVVAIVDDEFTLKRLATERGRPVLRAENKAYPVIRPRGELEIFGVVVGLLRRYAS